jgi:serine/threonine protein kinase
MPNFGHVLIPQLSVRPLVIVERHEGGFGNVQIVQSDDGVKTALKTLKLDPSIDRSALAAEAMKLAGLPSHPNVIQIIGFDSYDDGSSFIIMPAMNGNLRSLVRRGPVTTETAARVIGQVAFGLTHLHERRVLHLDLKPENILVAEDNRYVIADFGLSTFLRSPSDQRAHPEYVTSPLAGTIAYMSPEHFVTKRLSSKTDVFSLGVIFFELLTGRHPFGPMAGARSSPPTPVEFRDITWRIINETPSFRDSECGRIPSALRALCAACLDKNAANRPSAFEITEALGQKQQFMPGVETDIGSDVNRANTLWQLGRREEAVKLINECAAKNPFYLPGVVSSAEFAFAQGNAKLAAEITDKAVVMAVGTSPPPPGLCTLLVNLSFYYLKIDPEQAIRHARQSLQLDSDDWQALGNIAEGYRLLARHENDAHNKQDRLNQALSAVLEARRGAPADLNLLLTHGHVLVDMKDLQAVRTFISKTRWPRSVTSPGHGVNPHVGYLLIRIYITLGEFEESEKLLAPMRINNQLKPLVDLVEEEMAQRKREPLRAPPKCKNF